MRNKLIESLYVASLLFAPILVCLVEASQIEYPLINPLLGTPENPWPEFIRFSFFLGLFLAVIGSVVILLPNIKFKENNLRNLIWIPFSIITILLIWIVLGMAQQTAIYKYLALINANGLHFLGRYPFIYLENYSSTWSYHFYLSIGLLETLLTIVVSRKAQRQITSFS